MKRSLSGSPVESSGAGASAMGNEVGASSADPSGTSRPSDAARDSVQTDASSSSSASSTGATSSSGADQVFATVTAAINHAQHGCVPKQQGVACAGQLKVLLPASSRVPWAVIIIQPHTAGAHHHKPLTKPGQKREPDARDDKYMAQPWELIEYALQWLEPGRHVPFDLLAKLNEYLTKLLQHSLQSAHKILLADTTADITPLPGPLAFTQARREVMQLRGRKEALRRGSVPAHTAANLVVAAQRLESAIRPTCSCGEQVNPTSEAADDPLIRCMRPDCDRGGFFHTRCVDGPPSTGASAADGDWLCHSCRDAASLAPAPQGTLSKADGGEHSGPPPLQGDGVAVSSASGGSVAAASEAGHIEEGQMRWVGK